MTFKANWEKTSEQVTLPEGTIEGMIAVAFPHQKSVSYKLISGGCANLNYKIQLADSSHPYILRVYLRDPEAAKREQQIAKLIGSKAPIPRVEFAGTFEDYYFAITEFCQGITLRDLLLTEGCEVAKDVLTEIGYCLASIHSFSFPSSGFFDSELNPSSPVTQSANLSFGHESLSHANARELLGDSAISQLKNLLDRHSSLLPTGKESSLVHGDFGPENILVCQENDNWKLSAILDWEFAFSGSGLTDVANMLRYSHEMPDIFEESLIRGLERGGLLLPEEWRTRINLLNILALLDCLNRHPIERRPQQCSDIKSLLKYFASRLEEF